MKIFIFLPMRVCVKAETQKEAIRIFRVGLMKGIRYTVEELTLETLFSITGSEFGITEDVSF